MMKDFTIERLEAVLHTLRIETRAIEGHTDPGAIIDVWATVDDYIAEAKKYLCYQEFTTRPADGEAIIIIDSWGKTYIGVYKCNYERRAT